MAKPVTIVYGHFRIDPQYMQEVMRQQEMNEEEIERIVEYREMYLEWMHKRFAEKVVKPPG